MRRLHVLLVVGLLALALIPAPLALAQGDDGDFLIGQVHVDWAGVGRPEPLPGATVTDGEVLQRYEVYFSEDYAAVPEIPNSEFMIVQIVEGSFALAPDEGAFIVDPAAGAPIRILKEIPDEPYFLPTDAYVRDAAGQLCTRICAIPEDSAVMVTAGSTITVHEGSICLWCLLNSTPDTTDKGLLIVSVLMPQGMALTGFSWDQSWQAAQGGEPQASTHTAPVTLGWALLNPQARCRGGGP